MIQTILFRQQELLNAADNPHDPNISWVMKRATIHGRYLKILVAYPTANAEVLIPGKGWVPFAALDTIDTGMEDGGNVTFRARGIEAMSWQGIKIQSSNAPFARATEVVTDKFYDGAATSTGNVAGKYV